MKILIPNLDETVVKEFVTGICIDVVEADGNVGEIMCPTTIDNYARHVSIIIGAQKAKILLLIKELKYERFNLFII